MLFRLLCVSVSLWFSFLTAVGQATPLPEKDANALRAKFQARQRETRSWSAGFSQTLSLRGLGRPIASAGRIFFQAPDKLRIDFAQPAGEFVLVANGRVYTQKRGKRLQERGLEEEASRPFRSLLQMLRGATGGPEEEGAFSPNATKEDDGYAITLERQEKASSRLPRRIINKVTTSLEIREVTVELPNGGTVRYVFSEPQRNRKLDVGLFELPPPAP